MTPRTKNTLWFTVPAVVTAGVLTAITLIGGDLDEIQREAGSPTLAEPIIALILFAVVGGVAVGGIFYGVRRLSTRKKPSNS
ncbi:hypothetical protein [Microbacterium aurum]